MDNIIIKETMLNNKNQILILYQEFLMNYTILNRLFEMQNPVEIYAMFNYLLYNGYLSTNKKFEFQDQRLHGKFFASGSLVLTGKAVCRNISPMLTDILNRSQIKAYNLSTYFPKYLINIKKVATPEYSQEELANWINNHINDPKKSKKLIEKIERFSDDKGKNIELQLKKSEEQDFMESFFGNHVITMAIKDNKNYFLDSTSKSLFSSLDSDSYKLYNDKDQIIEIKKLKTLFWYNTLEEYLEIYKRLLGKYSSKPNLAEKMVIEKVSLLCENNKDVLNSFYNENKELYEEITNRIKTIKI